MEYNYTTKYYMPVVIQLHCHRGLDIVGELDATPKCGMLFFISVPILDGVY